MDAMRATLPLGYRLETGGATEESAKANVSINAGMPIFLVVVLTLLMLQLQSFQRVMMVVLTAPLGLIGVAMALLLFNRPFGFVAMLGTLALSGMIMRNSVILIDQIERNIDAGQDAVGRHHRRCRAPFPPDHAHRHGGNTGDDPAVAQRVFRPHGHRHHGRPVGRHVLTLLFLPALYAAWFRVKHP